MGKEAMDLLLRHAFLETRLPRVWFRVFQFNGRAIGLCRSVRFQEEGRQREALYRDGEWHDIILMGLLKREHREGNFVLWSYFGWIHSTLSISDGFVNP